ncbi:ubiquitin-like modifier-activating enzyme 6 [Styela clava]
MADKMEIDDSLYSRQRYMLGDNAMKRMASANVLLLGCDCLGVEVAKNLVLTGIGKLYVADSSLVTKRDIRNNFYVSQSDLQNKKTRAEACVPRLAELNPYVQVEVSTSDVHIENAALGDADSHKEFTKFLENIDCIIATQRSLPHQKYLDKLSCNLMGQLKFVSCNVYGVFSSLFCNFGKNFEILDSRGETLKEMFVGDITRNSEGTVTCLEDQLHGLEDGDSVSFSEVEGMVELNGQTREVRVVSPYKFTIGDTSDYSQYKGGGLVKEKTKKSTISHQSLDEQLLKPDILLTDFGKMDNPAISHAAFSALNSFVESNGNLPKLWNKNDAEALFTLFTNTVNQFQIDIPNDENAKKVVQLLSFTCRGALSPLATAIGGIAAQEVLKALTGKYTPLKQWLYLDATELAFNLHLTPEQMQESDDLSDVKACLGETVEARLAKLNIFMVGCGAIGCEMLKNFALLGVSTENGKAVITDNDVIEKSNLNRQFLFHSRHVGQSKSSAASLSVKEINPDIKIEPLQYKVQPDSENVFNDAFFESQDIVVNALDNVAARRYMDTRCVANQRPLLESGTMGPKGHVQIITPFVTESYGSQQDPADVEFPFCTLKSFPSNIQHTIQWARDKFEVMFKQKPMTYNNFWEGCQVRENGNKDNIIELVNKYLMSGNNLRDASVTLRLLSEAPTTWFDCVVYARRKFEKLFNHKAKDLLKAFPLDTMLQDGSPFWSLPKRPPTPIIFNLEDPFHMQFVISTASLIAAIYRVQRPISQEEIAKSIADAIEKTVVPDWVPSTKEVVVDEKAPAPTKTDEDSPEDLSQKLMLTAKTRSDFTFKLYPEDFEKDDDSNHHIDFISSAANLRAKMYGIENVDRLEIKRIAGRIIPAISTTTTAVSGFATIQFLQLVIQLINNEKNGTNWSNCASNIETELSKYRNCFLNLALPLVLFSEPAAAQKTKLTKDLSFSVWDRWEIRGNKDFKLKDFIQHFHEKYNLTISAVVHGSRMIYIPIMPGHSKRLDHLMTKLIKIGDKNTLYVDLTATFENPSDDSDDLSCPPIRYYF